MWIQTHSDGTASWVKTKLRVDPTSAIAASGDQFLNIYSQLNQEYDKMGEETEGQLYGDFASLAARQSKSLEDLRSNLREFEKKLKNFRERLGKDVDLSIPQEVRADRHARRLDKTRLCEGAYLK